jgi:hypothetical protein
MKSLSDLDLVLQHPPLDGAGSSTAIAKKRAIAGKFKD